VNKKGRFDPGLLLTLLLVLLAAWPFLARPGLPRDTDAELHVFRAAEVSACWAQGVLYPRWAPDFYYGYGYPIFNYYSPLTYHLASLPALLPGVSVVAGVRAVFVLGLALGGIGTYLLVRDLLGSAAGVVSCAAFLFAPYVLFIDPHARGDLAEHVAVGLLPLALFFLRHVVARGGPAALFGSVMSIAALPLTHNLIGAFGLVFLLLAFVWQVVIEGRRDGVGRGLLSFALAGAMSAFFWLPLLLELDAVKLTVVGGGHFDFRNHFVRLVELLAPSQRIDWGATAPRHHHNLGLAQWLLGVGGAAALVRSKASRRALGFFVLTALALVFFMVPLSMGVWERLPGVEYLQFPWRLLGPAALVVAVLAGGATEWIAKGRGRSRLAAAALVLVLLLALPLMSPPPWPADFGDTSPAGIVAFELEGKVVGTTSTGDFLPTTVETTPAPQPSMVTSYLEDGPIDKVNRATLPPGTTVQVLDHGPTHDRFLVSSNEGIFLRLYTFLFPGWRATVDGAEVKLKRARPEGLIYLEVPPGEHEVLLRFEDTPPRRAGWWIAGAGLLVLGPALLFVTRSDIGSERALDLSRSARIWLGGVVLTFLVFRIGVVPWVDWFHYTSTPGQAEAAQHEQHAVLGGEVELLGFDLPQRRVRAGEELTLVLYWRAREPLQTNYQSFAHLTHPTAVSWGQSDALNPGGLPTTRWPLDRYVQDPHQVRVRPGTPPGEYRLEVGLYTMEDGRRLPVLGPNGEPAGESVTLDVPVEVVRSRRPPTVEELEMDRRIEATYDDQITLLGYTAPYTSTGVPGFVQLTLFWQSERRHPEEFVITVAVVDEAGEPAAMASGAPATGRHPTSDWIRSEVVRDPYAFWLPADFDVGTYTVGVVVHRGVEPITPEGADAPFLEVLSVEVE
jgi:hypothetical protein